MLPRAVLSIRRILLPALFVAAIAIVGNQSPLTASPTGAAVPLKMRVYPEISFEPSNLRIQVSIEQNAENRGLEIIADSGDFYRSSAVQLDGEDSPRVSVFEFRDLPAGTYEVRGVLFGPNGHPRSLVSKQIMVIGRPR